MSQSFNILSWPEIKNIIQNANCIEVAFTAHFETIMNQIKNGNDDQVLILLNKNILNRPRPEKFEKWSLLPEKKFRLSEINGKYFYQEILAKQY